MRVRWELMAVVLGMTTLALAEPRPVAIRCGKTCTTADEPEPGESVVVSVEGAPGATLQVLVGRIPRACALPCELAWPGFDHVAIAGKRVTPPVARSARLGSIPLTTSFEPSGSISLKGLLEGGGLHGHPEIELVGGKLTPEHHGQLKVTVVGPGSEPTPVGADDLDTYVSDVVLVTSPTIGCSGIAIGRRSVLTARHCSSAIHVGVERDARQIEVFDVVDRAAPPDPALDLAVLTVSRDLGVSVRARATAPSDLPATGLARLVGFGTDNLAGTLGFGLKRQAFIGIASWACDGFTAGIIGCVPGREISFGSDVADTCYGDSGGPVMDVVDGHWRLVAIASRGVPGFGTPCGHGGIYTHVGAVADWLKAELDKEPR